MEEAQISPMVAIESLTDNIQSVSAAGISLKSLYRPTEIGKVYLVQTDSQRSSTIPILIRSNGLPFLQYRRYSFTTSQQASHSVLLI